MTTSTQPISGPTSIYGRIVSIGGGSPKVTVEMTDGKTLVCDSSRDIAKQLGRMLYSVVGLRGNAKWHAADMDLIAFTIEGVEDYEEGDVSVAFAELASLVGPDLGSIEDPEAYVRKLRREND